MAVFEVTMHHDYTVCFSVKANDKVDVQDFIQKNGDQIMIELGYRDSYYVIGRNSETDTADYDITDC